MIVIFVLIIIKILTIVFSCVYFIFYQNLIKIIGNISTVLKMSVYKRRINDFFFDLLSVYFMPINKKRTSYEFSIGNMLHIYCVQQLTTRHYYPSVSKIISDMLTQEHKEQEKKKKKTIRKHWKKKDRTCFFFLFVLKDFICACTSRLLLL